MKASIWCVLMSMACLIGADLTLDKGMDIPCYLLMGMAIILGISALIMSAETE